MTIAVIWREREGLWVAADTRFSGQGSASSQTLTDHGPKILSLPVVVRQPWPQGFFDHVKLSTTVGFAYAGAIVPALSSYAFCATVFSNLISDRQSPLPRFIELVQFVRDTSERYMRDWAELHPNNAMFKAIVFGWCPDQSQMQAFALVPKVDSALIVEIQQVDLSTPYAIGSGAQELLQRLKSTPPPTEPNSVFGEPLRQLESLVSSKVRDDVGGSVQLAYATQTGVSLFSRVTPVTPGKPIPINRFLGVDTNELGMIGACRIGMTGLA